MAGKGTAEILKLVELLKNGLAGVCLFLAGHNLWQLFQGKGTRREIIHAFIWAGLASVVVILTNFGKKVPWFKSRLQNKKTLQLENRKRNTGYLENQKYS